LRVPALGKRGHMPQGTVKWFNSEKDYNCISPDDGGGPRRVYSLTFLERLSGKCYARANRLTISRVIAA
jgi:hypothetical protein